MTALKQQCSPKPCHPHDYNYLYVLVHVSSVFSERTVLVLLSHQEVEAGTQVLHDLQVVVGMITQHVVVILANVSGQPSAAGLVALAEGAERAVASLEAETESDCDVTGRGS